MTISRNQEAISILTNAAQQLQAIGVDCLLSPLTLPQGTALTLHVGDSIKATIAADVATRRGAETAHAASTSEEFARDVAAALTEATS